MEFVLRTARPDELDALHGVISTAGWGIARESVEAILAWDHEAYLLAEGPADGPLGVVFRLGYGRTGWIGHLVVRPECRGGGIGTALFREAVAQLTALGKWPVYLTATELGAPLYRRFGFTEDGGWSRWRGTSQGGGTLPVQPGEPDVRPMREEDLAEVARFDATRFGDDRTSVLAWLFRRQPRGGRVAVRPGGRLAGYWLEGTEGLGPFVADADAARPLFREALRIYASRELSVTFPAANAEAERLSREAGFTPFRTWLRMRLGPDEAPPRDSTLFNASVAKG